MIFVFADLKSPLMRDRIEMLKDFDEKILLIHNADGEPLPQTQFSIFNSQFSILENPVIKNRTLRYIVSSLFTLYLITRYRPKLIIIHWASRLYQSLIFALFGSRCIVHTMGGDIEKEQDAKGHKKPYISILLNSCNTITVKSEYMKKALLKNFPKVDPQKIELLSWGVDERFFAATAPPRPSRDRLFFSIRAMKPFYRIFEIVESFIAFIKNSASRSKLVVSEFGADLDYKNKILQLVLEHKAQEYISLVSIAHSQMDEFLKGIDVVTSNAISDGLPQSLMEALAAKKFVIANRLPHYDGLLSHKKNSFLFDGVEGMQSAFEYADTMRLYYEAKGSDFLDAKVQKARYLELCKRILDGK